MDSLRANRFFTPTAIVALSLLGVACTRGPLGISYEVGQVALIGSLLLLGLLRLFALVSGTVRSRAATLWQPLFKTADEVEAHDPLVKGHSPRVAEWTGEIMRYLPIDPEDAEKIQLAARLHDIGKQAVVSLVSDNTGALTQEDWRIFRQHSERGAVQVSQYIEQMSYEKPEAPLASSDYSQVIDSVWHHHERWDGQGYPNRLSGPEIPLGSRIIAVADAFDWMTRDQTYRRALSIDQAITILRTDRGRHWDRAVVTALLRALAARGHNPIPRAIFQPRQALGAACE